MDFHWHGLKLVEEVDGSQHATDQNETRARALEHRGLTVLRFRDNQVLKDMHLVLQAILDTAQVRTPVPLPTGEGL
ncbi:MAG TPA: DUF559 domain-containing protein [Rhodanobacteraceae bacterium]|nr:DUF559 domain-containing protein [Rhodanobacteraceae bacterium]